MSKRRFSAVDRIKAFRFALKGVATLWREEPTTRFHAVTSLAAVALGFWAGLERIEWVLVVTFIGFAWFAEAVNTAIERLADAVTLEHHPMIGKAKDVASAAVLISNLTALIGGAIIFVPYLLR
ncbi:diacylglycerol kinase family protein [Sphingomicrobium sp. XHP0235]|uniref:diacylglycerol kinase n=1 Tax=Sphingomicrobium aquimarinum TaxID=3133971 RepID=UPI0031FEF7DC